ncbi:hypothetical protein JZ751_023247 [Albula glossodonta]|uniref:EGF-like domain-containing protein n=1 Tax=Albula glossodonta TaxID=121402 RepID=A0A8T2PJM9_9TELE|nr:hypothetical protein JZ751_023247 [Albula glossodonta]
MNGGVCSSRTHCLCPPGFRGRFCQFPQPQIPEAQGPHGSKQPVYTLQLVPDGPGLRDGTGQQQMAQTHSVITLPLAQGGGHHSSEVQVKVRVHHPPDTSVVIHPVDQSGSDTKPSPKPRLVLQTHKPRGRCFQETTPKQDVSMTGLLIGYNLFDEVK